MSNQYFSINREIFDIGFTSKSGAYDLQSRISSLVNGTLTRQMELLLEKVIPEELLYKFNTLTVDVGTVSLHNLEAELPEKFIEAFAAILDEQIRNLQSGAGDSNFEILPAAHSFSDLLSYFLYTGHLPWWAVKNNLLTPSAALDEMLLRSPAQLKALIVKAGQLEHVRKRLVNQFAKTQVRGIIQILEPTEAAYIFAFEDRVTDVKKETAIVQAEEKEFEKAVSYFILTYLLVERGGAFNRKEFAKSILSQIAAGFNIGYIDLLQIFYSVIETLTEEGVDYAASLKLLIQQLAAEEYETPQWKQKTLSPDQSQVSPDQTVENLNIIRQYLVSGTLPVDQFADKSDIGAVRALLFAIIKTIPDTFQLMLAQLSWNRNITDRLFGLIGTTMSREYIKILYGSRADTFIKIAATFSLLHKTRQTWNVAEQEFEHAVWHSVLSATLLSPVHLVDDRQLVHHLLAGLGSHLRVPVFIVAQRVQTGIKALFNVDHMQMRHLDLITEVLSTMQEGKDLSLLTNKAALSSSKEITEALFSNETQILNHLLRFILRYRSLPWWGRNYAGQSPVMLFQQLYEKSPFEAQLLFRYAGNDRELRYRWLQVIGIDAYIKILKSFDNSEFALRAYNQQKELYEVVFENLREKKPASANVAIVLADIVWKVLHEGRYRFFSLNDVYTKTFVSMLELLNVQPAILLTEWKRWLELADAETSSFRSVVEVLSKLYPVDETEPKEQSIVDHKETVKHFLSFLKEVKLMSKPDSNTAEPLSITEWLTGTDAADKDKIATYLLSLLKLYLISGNLPISAIKGIGTAKMEFFKLLLRVVYQINPLALVKVLTQSDLNAFRVLEITSLYQLSEGGEGKDIALLMLPVANKIKSASRLKVVEEVKIQGKREQEIFVEDILNLYAANQSVITAKGPSTTIYEILAYYLAWRRLPVSLAKTDTADGIIIKHLLRYLYETDKALLIQLWKEKTNQWSALVTVYVILSTDNTIEDKKIQKLISEEISLKPSQAIAPLPLTTGVQDIEAFTSVGDLDSTDIIAASLQTGTIRNELRQQKEWVNYLSEKSPVLYEQVRDLFAQDFHSSYHKDYTYFSKLIQNAFTDTLLRERVMVLFRYFNLQSWVQKITFRDSMDYFAQLIRYFALAMPDSKPILDQFYRQQIATSDETDATVLQVLIEQISVIQDMEASATSFNTYYDEKNAALISRDKKLEQEKIRESIERELKRAKEKERNLEAEEASQQQKEKNTRLFIPNAGLVILHPFFGTYFTRLGLMEANVFLSEQTKERAVLLLQYLATGRTKFEEYELILNKILCGLPIEQSVTLEMELTEQEMALTDELFEVLRQRWDKVKNSSVEGIRASFILREGALELIEEQWNLRVEQRGYDLLLQTLPWAFGFIKTSWMNQILTVEWI